MRCRKHGKFRPQLAGLVASNTEEFVESSTREAFASHDDDPSKYDVALKHLISLSGIGPATASLLLAIYDPAAVPFFSDELFRWVCWDAKAKWAAKIKYNTKEYELLSAGVKSLLERLALSDGGHESQTEKAKAVDLEKAAFVIGKLATDTDLVAALREEHARPIEREQRYKDNHRPPIVSKHLTPAEAREADELQIGHGESNILTWPKGVKMGLARRCQELRRKEWPFTEMWQHDREDAKRGVMRHYLRMKYDVEPRLGDWRVAGHHSAEVSMMKKIWDAMEGKENIVSNEAKGGRKRKSDGHEAAPVKRTRRSRRAA